MEYNFKKEAKLYAYSGGNLHQLDIYTDISVSQTFNESDYAKKTLHTPLSLYKGAVIGKANPANFSFTVPLRATDEASVLYTLMAPDYSTGNIPSIELYFKVKSVVYKIEKAVIESVVYNIDITSVMSVSITGTASKISEQPSLPAVPIITPSGQYLTISGIEVTLDDNVMNSIAAVHVEINNKINWLDNYTLQNSLNDSMVYPEKYVLSERRVSGSITQFLTDENLNQGSNYSTVYPIAIDILTHNGQIITFDLAESVFTRRLNIEEIITRVYDFRLTSDEVFRYPEI